MRAEIAIVTCTFVI